MVSGVKANLERWGPASSMSGIDGVASEGVSTGTEDGKIHEIDER